MTTSPLVSVLVPIWHVEEYIEQCARSLFEQTYSNLEFIFVDDASPDNSITILENVISEYPKRAPHVKILHHDQNKGLAATRNTLVEQSKGEFLFHVDSDDWIERNAITLLVKKQQESNADIVIAQAYSHFKNETVTLRNGGWDMSREKALPLVLKGILSPSIVRRLIRRSLYTNYFIKCEESASHGEDFQVYPRLLYYANKAAGIPDYIYHYRRTNTNSYVYSLAQSTKGIIQWLTGLQLINDFFADKEVAYQEALKGRDVKYLHRHLLTYATYSKKENYNKILNLLWKTNQEDWQFIHWDNTIKRFIDSNYYCLWGSFLFRPWAWKYFYNRISKQGFCRYK